MLKASVLIVIGLLCAGTALAQEGGIALMEAGTDINSAESLQRGARNFMNDCSGCHSLRYLRYNRMAADLKIPESELSKNLIFDGAKPFEEIVISSEAGVEIALGLRMMIPENDFRKSARRSPGFDRPFQQTNRRMHNHF